MTKMKTIWAVGLVGLMVACSQAHHESMEMADIAALEMSEEKAAPDVPASSSTAVENNRDSTRKFIRTAQLQFKVRDVIRSTYDIEEITGRHRGFVTFTNLTSRIDYTSTANVSADSTLESTHYTVENSMVLRVPNVELDSTLKEIARNIDFLDFRIIRAEDVALQILSNNLTQKRIAKNEERLTRAIDNRGKKLNETSSAEELLLNKQEQADNAMISNLSLADQISFSTVNLSIYQRQTIRREIIANDKNITAYEPGFGSKVLDALKCGLEIIEAVLVFVIRLWGFFVFGIIAYIGYRQYRKWRAK